MRNRDHAEEVKLSLYPESCVTWSSQTQEDDFLISVLIKEKVVFLLKGFFNFHHSGKYRRSDLHSSPDVCDDLKSSAHFPHVLIKFPACCISCTLLLMDDLRLCDLEHTLGWTGMLLCSVCSHTSWSCFTAVQSGTREPAGPGPPGWTSAPSCAPALWALMQKKPPQKINHTRVLLMRIHINHKQRPQWLKHQGRCWLDGCAVRLSNEMERRLHVLLFSFESCLTLSLSGSCLSSLCDGSLDDFVFLLLHAKYVHQVFHWETARMAARFNEQAPSFS